MPGKKCACVDMAFVPMDVFRGRPEVVPNMAPIVQVVPDMGIPPFRIPLSPEKFSFSRLSFVSSGMQFCSNAPPLSRSAKVFSIDSR